MAVAALAPTDVLLSVSGSRANTTLSSIAYCGVCLWIFVAPFEALRPLVRLPGQSISSVEAALLAVFLLCFVALVGASQRGAWNRIVDALRTPLTAAGMAFLVAAGVAAIAAPLERTNAIHMAGRFVLAFGVYLVTTNGVTTLARLRGVFVVSAATGVVVSLLAVLEFMGVPFVLRALTAFRAGVAVVGAQVRAAGPFQYPTIASMYLEVLFAFTLALLLIVIDEERRGVAWGAGVALAAMAEAITLSYARAGLVTMAASVAIVGWWRWRTRGPDRGVKALLVVAAVIAAEVLTSHSLDSARLRMTTEGQEHWYSAEIDAPLDLEFATGSTRVVPVTLTNTGLATWDSTGEHPVRFAYHWLLNDSDRAVDFEGARTIFPEPVPPGATVTLGAPVRAPGQPGRYRLMWDVAVEGRLWFSTEPDAELVVTRAAVTGPNVGKTVSAVDIPMPKVSARPGRLTLWRAGARMFRQHPLLGVGPDNFRLLYGGFAGIAHADPRVHSNNMYLEVLVGGGIVAAAAFAWLLWATAAIVLGAPRRAGGGDLAMATAGVTAAASAFAVHGLVDSFFSFTATYALGAITLGLLVACNNLMERHADRV